MGKIYDHKFIKESKWIALKFSFNVFEGFFFGKILLDK